MITKTVFLIIFLLFLIPLTSTSFSQQVPDWVKNTAGWWATDKISEQEFVTAIEFLIKSGIISVSNSDCSPREDINANGIPDEIEDIPNTLGMSIEKILQVDNKFQNKNWANCKMPPELSNLIFQNMDFTNTDFSNSRLVNSQFSSSVFDNTNFSNSTLYGVTFFKSEFNNTNFDNADFSLENWQFPFYTFTYKNQGPTFTCNHIPCVYNGIGTDTSTNEILTATFGSNVFPTNLRLIDSVFDESDQRTIWRNVATFIFSEINNSNFDNADLSYATIQNSNLQNIDFTNTDMSQVLFFNTDLENVTMKTHYIDSKIFDRFVIPEKKYKSAENVHIEKIGNNYDPILNIKFLTAMDDIIINWAMGMLIHEDKLYIADTDNHRILVYDKNALNSDEFSSIISPKQNFCDGVNAFTPETYPGITEDCSDDLRNIPTSLAIINDKIFTAYGMQHEIQIFDKNGKYLTSFGIKGNNDGEFNFPYRIFSSNDQLFVADSGNQRIQIFDNNGNFLKKISTNVNSITNSFPSDVIVSNNQIFVFDSNNSSVYIFDIDGNLLRSFQINTNIPKNSLVGFDIYEELLFISASDNDKVLIVDINGNNMMSFGKSGTKYGEFNFPLDIIVDESQLYVSDGKNYRIQVFSIVK